MLYYVLRQDVKARRVDLHTDLNWSQSAVYKFQYLELGNFNFPKRNAEFSLWNFLVWKSSNFKSLNVNGIIVRLLNAI